MHVPFGNRCCVYFITFIFLVHTGQALLWLKSVLSSLQAFYLFVIPLLSLIQATDWSFVIAIASLVLCAVRKWFTRCAKVFPSQSKAAISSHRHLISKLCWFINLYMQVMLLLLVATSQSDQVLQCFNQSSFFGLRSN